jgi:hypothetical protein
MTKRKNSKSGKSK